MDDYNHKLMVAKYKNGVRSKHADCPSLTFIKRNITWAFDSHNYHRDYYNNMHGELAWQQCAIVAKRRPATLRAGVHGLRLRPVIKCRRRSFQRFHWKIIVKLKTSFGRYKLEEKNKQTTSNRYLFQTTNGNHAARIPWSYINIIKYVPIHYCAC